MLFAHLNLNLEACAFSSTKYMGKHESNTILIWTINCTYLKLKEKSDDEIRWNEQEEMSLLLLLLSLLHVHNAFGKVKEHKGSTQTTNKLY